MSLRTIPSKKIATCDRCGTDAEVPSDRALPVQWTDLKHNNRIGNDDDVSEIDLCRKCSDDFDVFMLKKEPPDDNV